MNFHRFAIQGLAVGTAFLVTGALVVSSPPVSEEPAGSAPRVEVPAPRPLQSRGKAKLRGTVTIKGAIPRPRRIRTTADPKCAALHRGKLFSEDIVADPRGRVSWAFIYIKKGLEGKEFPLPKKPVVVSQKGCRFDPHVLGVMVGQKLTMRNLDPLMHIVHVRPDSNREWAFSQDLVGETRDKTFTSPEVMIRLFCDVHTWMTCWVGVLNHPFHTVSGRFGKYELKDLPPGKYTIEAWHEKYQAVTQEVELKPRKTVTLDFTLTTPR